MNEFETGPDDATSRAKVEVFFRSLFLVFIAIVAVMVAVRLLMGEPRTTRIPIWEAAEAVETVSSPVPSYYRDYPISGWTVSRDRRGEATVTWSAPVPLPVESGSAALFILSPSGRLPDAGKGGSLRWGTVHPGGAVNPRVSALLTEGRTETVNLVLAPGEYLVRVVGRAIGGPADQAEVRFALGEQELGRVRFEGPEWQERFLRHGQEKSSDPVRSLDLRMELAPDSGSSAASVRSAVFVRPATAELVVPRGETPPDAARDARGGAGVSGVYRVIHAPQSSAVPDPGLVNPAPIRITPDHPFPYSGPDALPLPDRNDPLGIFTSPSLRLGCPGELACRGVQLGRSPVLGFYAGFVSPATRAVRIRVRVDRPRHNRTIVLDRSIRWDELAFENQYFEVSLGGFAKEKVDITFLGEEISLPGGAHTGEVCIGSPILIDGPRRAAGRGILLISLDTLRADRLGCYGYPFPTSPNLDELARECTRFENAYAQSVWTLPSHMSVWTSLHQSQHGVDRFDEALSEGIRTFPEILRGSGLQTAAFTNGTFVYSAFGFDRGFDLYHNGVAGDWDAVREHRENLDVTGGRALLWLDRHARDGDHFLFVHTYDVHGDYNPPMEYVRAVHPGHSYSGRIEEIRVSVGDVFLHDLMQRRLDGEPWPVEFQPEDIAHVSAMYDGNVRRMDEHLGRFLNALRGRGLYDDLTIVVFSDHGEELYDHGSFLHMHTVYQELIRVPLLVKFPKDHPLHSARTVRTPVPLLDIAPTLLDLAGIPSPRQFEGASLLHLVRGESRGGEAIYAESDRALRIGEVRGGYKTIGSSAPGAQGEPLEYYHLGEDPRERRNLAGDPSHRHGAETRRGEMLRQLEDWRTQQRDWGPDLGNMDPVLSRQLGTWSYGGR